MPDVQTSWPWISLAAFGAFHGLNPAMGWLFAVALGLQTRRWRAVPAALGWIAAGHALAIAAAVVAIGLLGLVIPQQMLLTVSGVALLGFAIAKAITRFRHPRGGGMRVGWSFLMATAHGAGLMLVPVLVHLRGEAVPAAVAQAGHPGHQPSATESVLLPALMAVGVHTVAMLAVAGLLATLVYRWLGVEILRRAWLNLDLLWVGAVALTGAVALLWGIGPFPLT